MSFFKQMLTLLEEHPNVPAILSWWAQLVVNLSLFSLAVWMVFSFVSEIRNEFDAVASKEMDSILHNIAECMQRYEDNKCAAGNLVPGLVPICAADRKCMDTDPTHVRRAMLSARTMAQIIDSFIEPISWKAIVSHPPSLQSLSNFH
jgi:magnesium-transporting ATPase (P-type)